MVEGELRRTLCLTPGVAGVVEEAALAHLDAEGRLVEGLDLRVLKHAVAEVQKPAGQVPLVAVDEQALVVVAGASEHLAATSGCEALRMLKMRLASHLEDD